MYNEAIKYFIIVLNNNLNNYKSYYNLAVAYHKSNNINKAIYYYEKTLELNSNNINSYYNLGLIYQEKSNINIAIKSL